MNYYLAKPQTHERAGTSFGNSNVSVVNTTPPRKPHKLFSRSSLIFIFCIVAITLLSGCPAPAGPKGAQGDRGEQGETGDKGDKGDAGDSASAPALRECHSINGYPTACYDASTGVLTFTGINLADVGTDGTADDVDTSKLSIVGKGGNDDVISLTVTPTITKVDTSEFSLTVDTTDRESVFDILDIVGHSASDGSPYSIVLAQNWNGLPSPALSMPVRTTNVPPGYCGDFSAAVKSGRPTVDGTANSFFGGGTGTETDPYTLTMRPYCDDLTFDWNPNYPAIAGTAHGVYFHVTVSTSGDYDLTFAFLELPASGLTQVIESPEVTGGFTQIIVEDSYTIPYIQTRLDHSIDATVGLTFLQSVLRGSSQSNAPLVGSNRLRIVRD